MALNVICLKKCYGITYFMIKIYFKTASLPRGSDTDRKWSVSQNDQNIDIAFLPWGQIYCLTLSCQQLTYLINSTKQSDNVNVLLTSYLTLRCIILNNINATDSIIPKVAKITTTTKTESDINCISSTAIAESTGGIPSKDVKINTK